MAENRYPLATVTEIVDKKLAGESTQDIVNTVIRPGGKKVSRTHVYNIIKRYKLHGTLNKSRGGGRKCSLSEEMIETIKEATQENRFVTIPQIASRLQEVWGINVHRRVIERVLSKHGWKKNGRLSSEFPPLPAEANYDDWFEGTGSAVDNIHLQIKKKINDLLKVRNEEKTILSQLLDQMMKTKEVQNKMQQEFINGQSKMLHVQNEMLIVQKQMLEQQNQLMALQVSGCFEKQNAGSSEKPLKDPNISTTMMNCIVSPVSGYGQLTSHTLSSNGAQFPTLPPNVTLLLQPCVSGSVSKSDPDTFYKEVKDLFSTTEDRTTLAVQLFKRLFPDLDEVNGKTVLGHIPSNTPACDPQRIEMIKKIIFDRFNLKDGENEKVEWYKSVKRINRTIAHYGEKVKKNKI